MNGQDLDAARRLLRVEELVARFRVIGQERMRDLPLYNARLEVEAVGFRPFGEQALGVLVTPWCMNLLLLPLEVRPADFGRIGRKVSVDLPAGPWTFVEAGDEVIGGYAQHSLHSPMAAFAFPEAARIEAGVRLREALRPPRPDADPAPAAAAGPPRTMDRRSFLRGARAG